MWISFGIRFGTGFRRSQPRAQTCETLVVDQVVDQPWDHYREAPSLKLRLVRHRQWIRLWFDLGICFRPSHRLAQTCETQAVVPSVDQFSDQFRDMFRRSQLRVQTFETQAVDQVVDQLCDRCK